VRKYETLCTQLVDKVCDMCCVHRQKHIANLSFSFPNVTLPTIHQLFLIFFGTGFEVFTVVGINRVVWVRTSCSLINGYECFGGAF
jgi:hypothetical protein